MKRPDAPHRREFLRAAAVSAGAAFGSWSFRVRAELMPGKIRIGQITDPSLDTITNRLNHGILAEQAGELVADLKDQFTRLSPAVDLIMEGDMFNDVAAASHGGRFEGKGFLVLAMPHPSDTAGLQAFVNEMMSDPTRPLIVTNCPPQIECGSWSKFHRDPDHGDHELWTAHPRMVLWISGMAMMNRAGLIAGTNCLNLVTASPALYPCGGRLIDVEVKAGGEVRIESRFVQTRLLHLVEESFQEGGKERLMENLGTREDRTLIAVSGAGSIERTVTPLDPNLAPWWSGSDEVTLAVLSDTHLCLDRFVPPDESEYGLIGHFTEAGSRAILSDIVDQVGAGRHRVEFFDEVFARDPADDRHYLDLAVDTVLVTGDLNEHGRLAEADAFLELMGRLPAGLRQKTMVVPGNHDLYQPEFSPNGAASSREIFCAKHNEYLPQPDQTSYVVHLSDWLTLIPLDSVIAAHSGLGMIQEKIDWLEDMLDQLQDRVVVVACHHPIYRLSLVPAAMRAYLKSRSHFTPKHSPFRVLLQDLFARHSNVKLALSGHYHGVVTDRFAKTAAAGPAPDDGFTTHLQVPCTVEYPCGYRLFRFKREGGNVTVDYYTAYTREAELREESRRAPIFKVLGTNPRVPHQYQGTIEKIKAQDSFFGEFARLDPYDLTDLNVRGFKDGTARAGKGHGGKANINGNIKITIEGP